MGAEGEHMPSTFSRRTFLTALGMLSVPLIALAQDRQKKEGDNKSKEEKKKEAEKKADEKKDKAEDAKVVDAPGSDRRQDRRRDGPG
jgi:hypothetical protein